MEQAKTFLQYNFNDEDAREVQKLVDEEQVEELEKRMSKRISFGTAGLRAEMKAGFAYMCDLTVMQATQGWCAYSLPELLEKGVLIGYDHRHRSARFADIAAAVFHSKGIKVWKFDRVVPTPFVAHGIKVLGAAGGLMVTASHNPSKDNGYKVYAANGAQILRQAKPIAASILENLEPWEVDLSGAVSYENPLQRVSDSYYQAISAWSFRSAEENARSKLIITFSAMHGVGGEFTAKSFATFGLPPYVPCMEQLFPDPEFPTADFPNPEERGALRLAYQTAERVGSTVIIANDPDADRCAAAERLPDGSWKQFTGNEIGTLLAVWLFDQFMKKNPDTDKSKLLLANTVVSSKFLQAVAKKEGLQYVDTLTGFKYLANAVIDAKDTILLLAYEQAIGYMVGDPTFDKDGVSAAAVFGEMASQFYDEGSTLVKHLESAYERYGYYATVDSYYFCYDTEVMKRIFKDLGHPDEVAGFKLSRMVDLLAPGYDSAQSDNKPVLDVGSSPMIMLYFENGAVLTLRGSGTEPKLKYYIDMPGKNKKDTDALLQEMIQKVVVDGILKPEQNDLKAPSK